MQFATVAAMTLEDVRAVLRQACIDAGSQQAWAEKYKISPAYVSDVLVKRREPGPAILKALRIKIETNYIYVTR